MQNVNTDRRVRLTLTIALTVLFVVPVFGQTHQGLISGEDGDIRIDKKAEIAMYVAAEGTFLEVNDHRRLRLAINSIPDSLVEIGITEQSVRTRLELRFRSLNLTPLNRGKDEGLNVTLLGVGDAFSIHLDFIRLYGNYFVDNDQDLNNGNTVIYRSPITTWEHDVIGTHVGDPAYVLFQLEESLNHFLNEYLEANMP